MTFTDMAGLLFVFDRLSGVRIRWRRAPVRFCFRRHDATSLASVLMRFLIAAIRGSYAERRPAEGSEGGRLPRLLLRRRRCALLYPVRGLAAGRSARGRDGPGARRAPPARGQPHGG